MDGSFDALKDAVLSSLGGVQSLESLGDAEKFVLSTQLEKLSAKLAPPTLYLQRLTQGSNGLVAVRLAIATGIFDAFAQNGNSVLSLDELHSKTKGDKLLIGRLSRLLASRGLLHQEAPDAWQPTQLGAMMAGDHEPAMMIVHFYAQMKAHAQMLEYFERNNFHNPSDYYSSPMSYAWGFEDGYFNWLAEDSLRQQSFNTVMKINQKYRGQDWFDFFPVLDKIGSASDPEKTLLVDIGGGVGHDALGFRKKHSQLTGKVVLQDLPQVIQNVEGPLPPAFEAQAYDMFTTQPVKGAKVYYLRTVLHDWPDKQALHVLKNVREAMDDDSLLLVNENIMAEMNPSDIAVDVDFIMMTSMSALERTDRQWHELLSTAGFEVKKVWHPETQVSQTALFEAVPKPSS